MRHRGAEVRARERRAERDEDHETVDQPAAAARLHERRDHARGGDRDAEPLVQPEHRRRLVRLPGEQEPGAHRRAGGQRRQPHEGRPELRRHGAPQRGENDLEDHEPREQPDRQMEDDRMQPARELCERLDHRMMSRLTWPKTSVSR